MENRRATKRALLTSITALVMCVVMLAGTTFAWFTDTASTNVNKIQAGNLKVDIVDANNENTSLAGRDLKWVRKTVNGVTENVDSSAILWEPGVTFSLQPIKVKNAGNLAIKYTISITGIGGDAKLNEVITWKINGSPLDAMKDIILAPNTSSNELIISGTMDTNANNDYMNLSIDGISITVNATQASYEYDSNGNNYDEDAVTPVSAQAVGNLNIQDTTSGSTTATVKSEQTISDGTMSVTYPANVALTGVNATGETGSMKTSVTQKLEYIGDTLSTAAASANIKVADGKAVAQYELTLPVDTSNTTTLIRIAVNYAKNLGGLEIYHNGVKLPTTAAAADEPVREYFNYDRDTGVLELYLFHASPIDIIYNASDVLKGATGVSTAVELKEAVEEDGVVYLKNDIEVSSAPSIKKTVTLDLNGYTLTGTAYNTIKVTGGNLTVQDTSAAQNGKIANTYSGKANPTTVDMTSDGATFTLLSGTVESNAKDDLYSLAIGNSKKKPCTINIAGGTVANPDGHVKSRAISASKGMNLNISGGTVSGGLYGVDVYAGSITTITGGTITARCKDGRTDEYGKTYAIHARGEAALTIGSETVITVPEIGGIKFESSGVKTELPTITLLRGNITNPIYSLETKYNYELFKLNIAADAPVTFVDDTAHFFLPDGLKMTQDGSTWTVTKSAT